MERIKENRFCANFRQVFFGGTQKTTSQCRLFFQKQASVKENKKKIANKLKTKKDKTKKLTNIAMHLFLYFPFSHMLNHANSPRT